MGRKRIRKIFYIKERKRVMGSAIVCIRLAEREGELLMSMTASGNSSCAVSSRSLANDSSIGTHMSMSVGPTHQPN